MTTCRILVAGIGNIVQQGDGFGEDLAWWLMRREPRTSLRIDDFGVRGRALGHTRDCRDVHDGKACAPCMS